MERVLFVKTTRFTAKRPLPYIPQPATPVLCQRSIASNPTPTSPETCPSRLRSHATLLETGGVTRT